jgi:hypothetical protein
MLHKKFPFNYIRHWNWFLGSLKLAYKNEILNRNTHYICKSGNTEISEFRPKSCSLLWLWQAALTVISATSHIRYYYVTTFPTKPSRKPAAVHAGSLLSSLVVASTSNWSVTHGVLVTWTFLSFDDEIQATTTRLCHIVLLL